MSGYDVGFFQTDDSEFVDLVIENGDLKADNSLETAVLISLFSDRYVRTEDLPEGENDNRGWWADHLAQPLTDLYGSNLWIADRNKITTTLLNILENGVNESLSWMIDEGIAQSIDVSVERISLYNIIINIDITKPSGDNIPFKYLWDAQELKIVEVN